MFSKKLSSQPAFNDAATAPREGLFDVLPTNRYVALAFATLMFFAAAAGLVAATGNPHDGAPVVRAPITLPAGAANKDFRSALSPQDTAAASSMDPSSAIGADGQLMDGQAVILMPGAALASHGPPLAQAPIAGLTAPGPGGLLPIIAADGRTPSKAYARPFQDNGRPKVSLIIGGLGLNAKATRDAIDRLPPEITLSFVPYADGLQGWIDLARASGHEVLLEIPMEPLDFPDNDPGPYTLMANDQPAATIGRMEWLLSRATGYFGVTNYLGGRFLGSDKGMGAFGQSLRQRGLAFIDDGSAAKRTMAVPRASASHIVDEQLDGDAIDRQLLTLEAQALQTGASIGAGFAYPLTIAQVQRWAASVGQRGYAPGARVCGDDRALILGHIAGVMSKAAPRDLSHYRPNVGIVLINAEGKVWLGRRAKTDAPHNWQFPQGGVDAGEDLQDAALRELAEETGVRSVAVLGRTEDWIAYDFPRGWTGAKAIKGWRGQKQVWFALRFTGQDSEIDLKAHLPPEFDAWRWADIDDAVKLVVPFKRAAYEQVVAAFRVHAAPAPGPNPNPSPNPNPTRRDSMHWFSKLFGG